MHMLEKFRDDDGVKTIAVQRQGADIRSDVMRLPSGTALSRATRGLGATCKSEAAPHRKPSSPSKIERRKYSIYRAPQFRSVLCKASGGGNCEGIPICVLGPAGGEP
jgi:hypothetical protein